MTRPRPWGRGPVCLRGLLCAALIVGCSLASGPTVAALYRDPARHVVIDGPPAGLNATRQLLDACGTSLDRYLGKAPAPATPLTVFLPDPESPGRPSPEGALVVPGDAQVATLCHALTIRLLARHPAAAIREHDQPPPPLGWLVAAVTFDVLHARGPGTDGRGPNYQPARAAYGRGAYPDIAALLTQPMPPRFAIAYTLYGMHCHIFTEALLDLGSPETSPLPDLVKRLAGGTPPTEALTQVADTAAKGQTPVDE